MLDLETQKKWEALLLECRSGAQSVTNFCKERGIKKHNYYYWQKALKKRRPGLFPEAKSKKPGKSKFARVSIRSVSRQDIEIILANQIKISCSEHVDTSRLQNIVSVLESR